MPGIIWHYGGLASDEALQVHVARTLDTTPGHVAVGRQCPWCGSDRHGRPWVRTADGRRPHVSLARAGGHLVTAVSPSLRTGIDVESVRAVDQRWDPTLVLHPTERADSPEERAAMWCRKEAILKALGTGLRRPMSQIRCRDWPVEDIAAPPGLAAAVVALDQAGSGGRSTA